MRKFYVIIIILLFCVTGYAQLTNTTSAQWGDPNNIGVLFTRQTNLVSEFYKFLITYNNFYLDIFESGHDNNMVYNVFPGTTTSIAHYINMVGSSNENQGVRLSLGNIPSGITINLSVTNTPAILSGAAYQYNAYVTVPADYTGTSFSFYVTNFGSTNAAPFPYRVIVRHTVNIVQQDVLVERATDGIHTVTVFDGSQPLGNLKAKVFANIQGTITPNSTIYLYYDMNTAPDGTAPDGTADKNRRVTLSAEDGYYTGFIPETDPEVKLGNIVNFIIAINGYNYYNNGDPWKYVIREYATQVESDNTISINNKFNPGAGEKYHIIYKLNRNSHVNIKVLNVRGETVRTLKNEQETIGRHFEEWDGRNDAGKLVAMGLYLVSIQTADYSDIRKLILIVR